MNEPSGKSYTLRTRDWLDGTFSIPSQAGRFVAHEPIFGFGRADSAPGHAVRLARVARLLRILEKESFEDFLDVGSAEGYVADLVRDLFDVRVAACDLSSAACLRARELFGVPSFACNASRLPFDDAAFDCVLCGEVLEHLEDPFAALAELMRVTRRVLVLTTQECAHLEWQRRLMLKLRQPSKPHLERNWWMPGDFPALLGDGVEVTRQVRVNDAPRDSETDLAALKRWLRQAVDPAGIELEGFGVIVVWRRSPRVPGRENPSRLPQDEALWDLLIAPRPLLAPRPIGGAVAADEEAWLRERLRCPMCGGVLDDRSKALTCVSCGSNWPRRGAVADLTVDRADETGAHSLLNAAHVRRLKKLFSMENVLTGRKVMAGRVTLAFVELLRDIGMTGRAARPALRSLRHRLAEILRDLDPKAEGWLVRARDEQAIYRIEKGRKRHIVTDRVFFERGYVFDRVKEVEPEWLERFPEGEPIGPAGA